MKHVDPGHVQHRRRCSLVAVTASPVEKVRHHLLPAGIEGTTILTNPQQSSLLCDQGFALGAAHRRRDPLYLRRRGALARGTCLSHQLPSIPALPQHDQVPTQPCRFFPRHMLNGTHDPMLPVEGDGRANELAVHDHQPSSIRPPGRFIGGVTLLLYALALDPCLSAEGTPARHSLGIRGSLWAQAVWCGSDWPDDNPWRGFTRDLTSRLASAMLGAPNGGDGPMAATA
jgi:hypothetical protein